jgi:lysophospholipase L1-like esterase
VTRQSEAIDNYNASGSCRRSRHAQYSALLPVIDRINGNLSRFADGQKVRYLNINDKLADGDGRLFDGMMNASDKLHPTVKAYQIWADALKPVLTELLGPPIAVDQAPPPTGDPSTVR